MNVTECLLAVQQTIRQYEKKYHRKEGSVRLLVASKGRDVKQIAELMEAGQHCFGENYLQEALPKIAKFPEVEWHFIGPIQSNKTRKIAEHFNWVESVDDIKIAKRLNDQRPAHLPPLNICIEINVGHEKTKSGITSDDLFAFAKRCLELPHLKLRGLMTIPAPHSDFQRQCAAFKQLAILWKKLPEQLSINDFKMDTLSMGMSDDMEAAIAEGSTLVRIGRAIFEE